MGKIDDLIDDFEDAVKDYERADSHEATGMRQKKVAARATLTSAIAEMSPRWIPVAEKMPEPHHIVLVYGAAEEGGTLKEAAYYRPDIDGWTMYHAAWDTTIMGTYGIKITHWMEVPADPEPPHA